MMDNHKSEFLETVETVSKFAGTLAGKLVVCSKEICDCAKNMMAAKLEPKPKPSGLGISWSRSRYEDLNRHLSKNKLEESEEIAKYILSTRTWMRSYPTV